MSGESPMEAFVGANIWKQDSTVNNIFNNENISQNAFTEENIENLPIECLLEIFENSNIQNGVIAETFPHQWKNASERALSRIKCLDMDVNTWCYPSYFHNHWVDEEKLKRVLLRCGSNLKQLDLFQHDRLFSSNTIMMISELCPNLESLNAPYINATSSAMIELFRKCTNLTKLMIGSIDFEYELSHIFEHTKLEYFAIGNVDYPTDITGKCLVFLPETIQDLHLNNCTCLQTSWFHMALDKLPNLRSISLNWLDSITDYTLELISEKSTIVNIQMCGNGNIISPEGMYSLANLTNLQSLYFESCSQITDKFLERIAYHCKHMKKIIIVRCPAITNNGIATLNKLKYLEKLRINDVVDLNDLRVNAKFLTSTQNNIWDCSTYFHGEDYDNLMNRGVIDMFEENDKHPSYGLMSNRNYKLNIWA